MNTETLRPSVLCSTLDSMSPDMPDDTVATGHSPEVEQTVDYVVDDCFFTVGQVVGTRKTLDYEAVMWWRDHYRLKFLKAMQTFGDRWLEDRQNVTAVALMLAERAVRYAEDADSIDVASARRAAADVERYCALHSRRAARARGGLSSDATLPLVAGYWCIDIPKSNTASIRDEAIHVQAM